MNIWIKGLVNSLIAGAATAGSSWMALLGAKAAGMTVPELNLKALGAILVMGSLTNLFSYLRSSPMFQTQTTVTQVTTTKENS